MTEDEIEGLHGVDLARACAEAMGWKKYEGAADFWYGDTVWLRHISGEIYGNSFRPDIDRNHAAELRAWAIEKYKALGMVWELRENSDDGLPPAVSTISFWAIDVVITARADGPHAACLSDCRTFLLLRKAMREKGAG